MDVKKVHSEDNIKKAKKVSEEEKEGATTDLNSTNNKAPI
jgi:hypothetical protein